MPFVRNSLGIRELMAQAFKSDKQLKVLVTGNSSCGKTTFIRKIRLRMGDSISDMEKEALKIVVYSEFIALVKSHRHELRCKAHSIQSAEKCVPNFWSQVDGCAPSQWCQEVREALQKISEDPSVWQTMEERLPKHSYLRNLRSYSADIFGEKWLPLDADVIQSHVTSSGTESTIVDSRIAFIEENLDTLRSNYVKNVGADVKLVVLLVGLTGSEPDESQFSSTLDRFVELLEFQKARGGFVHLIFNDFTSLDKMIGTHPKLPNDMQIESQVKKVCKEPCAMADSIIVLESSWMDNVLRTWEEISPQKLISGC